MIHVGRGAPQASMVELRRGQHVIVARVVWRDGSRAGLRSDDRLPVEEILSLSQAPALGLTVGSAFVERRHQPRRDHERNRWRSRWLEFASVAVLGGGLALALFGMVEQALARPMEAIRTVLAG